jgi:uncharacterized protein
MSKVAMKRAMLGLIRLYQSVLSPYWPGRCRYTPTCSHYAREAVERLGPWRGSLLALRRLLRCRPFGDSGYDPVPHSENTPAMDDHDAGEAKAATTRNTTVVR